jgi:phosphatidate cytidylyltransferase
MLKKRLLSALVIGVAVLLGLFVPGVPGALFFSLLCAVCIWLVLDEFASLADAMGIGCMRLPLRTFGALLVVGYSGAAIFAGRGSRIVAELSLLTAFLGVTAYLAMNKEDLRQAMVAWLATVAGMALLYGTLSFAPRTYFLSGLDMGGRYLLFYLFAVTKFGDTGAYTAGVLTAKRRQGNHKLWPRLSPRKSWEGLLGGIVASVVCGCCLLFFLPVGDLFGQPGPGRFAMAGLVSAALAVTGLLGDLAESALKRAAGAKDSGAVPGLGGVFDFADSLIFNAPLFYIFAVW